MNHLSVFTEKTESPDCYLVSWRTGLLATGRVCVRMAVRLDDGEKAAAELAAARHLLEDMNVCGHDKAGKNLLLTVSCGAVKKLVRAESAFGHLSPYANFLRTRFSGATIECENRKVEWVRGCVNAPQLDLVVEGPIVTTLEVGGIGKVVLSSHALERYVERYGAKIENAWRLLRQRTPDAIKLNALPKSVRSLVGRERAGEASYAVSKGGDMILVVVPATRWNPLPTLTTLYVPDSTMSEEIRRAIANTGSGNQTE